MPIEPIDLQVLFSRTLDVGKDQAAQNDLPNVAQSLQAGELVKETESRSNSVNETEESDEVRAAHDSEEEGARGRGGKRGREKRKPGRPAVAKTTLSDPNLGKNIDITG
jgi:hypothetical protein